jgi:hypothetical protein
VMTSRAAAQPLVEAGRRCPETTTLTEPGRWSRLSSQVTGRRASLDRLQEGVLAACAAQRVRHERRPHGSPTPGGADAALTCRLIDEYLGCAAAAYTQGAADRGWGFLHRVRETETLLLDRSELDAVAVALAAECDGEKIPGWRRDAVQGLLQRMHVPPYPVLAGAQPAPDAEPAPAVVDAIPGADAEARLHWDARLVREALVDRDEHFGNTYASLSITAHRRLWLLVVGAVLLVVVLAAMSRVGDLDPPVGAAESPSDVLVHAWVPLIMVALGALGSVVSAIQRLAVNPLTGPIPAQLGSFTATATRPLIGGVAALTVFLAALGGLAIPEQHPVPLLFLAAFTAGLTERLVVYRGGGQRSRQRAEGTS